MRKMQSCPPEVFAMYEHRAIYSVFVHLNFVNICLHGKHTYIFYILNLSIYRYIYQYLKDTMEVCQLLWYLWAGMNSLPSCLLATSLSVVGAAVKLSRPETLS